MSQPLRVPVTAGPQSKEVGHATILAHEKAARETFGISEDLHNGTTVHGLPDKPNPNDVLKKVNDFGILSSDLAVCGESIVSLQRSSVVQILTNNKRSENVFFRAIALLEAAAVDGNNRKDRAVNAVRRARVETKAEYEARKVARKAAKEKKDTSRYLKTGSLKR